MKTNRHTINCDLHLHLGGSVSKSLLVTFAKADNNKDAVTRLQTDDVLSLFSISHELLNSPARITEATVDVIGKSTADYLELRTTPRVFPPIHTKRDYLNAFILGLKHYPHKAKGILSIDRYKHDKKDAKEIIGLALQHPDHIVGVDISGYNPTKKRILRGTDLSEIITMILNTPLGLALHIGELDSEEERQDSTTSLHTIDDWFQQHPSHSSIGKIRLGHALYLEEEHMRIVRKHNLPIEICPSCHRLVGSWPKGKTHPVEKVYTAKDSPVVIGTDDALIFDTDHAQEMKIAQCELPFDTSKSWLYRFG